MNAKHSNRLRVKIGVYNHKDMNPENLIEILDSITLATEKFGFSDKILNGLMKKGGSFLYKSKRIWFKRESKGKTPNVVCDDSDPREWQTIKSFPLYEITEDGTVRNLAAKNIIRPKPKNGYLEVSLIRDGHRFSKGLHRLIAETFIPNSDAANLEVNHKDGNRQNNQIGNIEWVTIEKKMLYTCIKSSGKETQGKVYMPIKS